MSAEESGGSVVDQMLRPLEGRDGPCGLDLEYDNAFLELNAALAGTPETQFRAAVAPDWRTVAVLAHRLSARTHDLRVAVIWTRAATRLQGLAGFAQGLRLIEHYLVDFADTVHPGMDDGDPWMRVNALAPLPQHDGLLGDLREAVVFTVRGVGELRVKAIESALALPGARTADDGMTRSQVAAMAEAAVSADSGLVTRVSEAADRVDGLQSAMEAQLGSQNSIDLKPLRTLLRAVLGVMPAPPAETETPGGTGESGTSPAPADQSASAAQTGVAPMRSFSAPGTIASREDAVRAIDMVCEFLDRTEPTNPAPLLLRRARRLINHNFLQLMKELAPEALSEVARVMGVDPETVTLDDAT